MSKEIEHWLSQVNLFTNKILWEALRDWNTHDKSNLHEGVSKIPWPSWLMAMDWPLPTRSNSEPWYRVTCKSWDVSLVRCVEALESNSHSVVAGVDLFAWTYWAFGFVVGAY